MHAKKRAKFLHANLIEIALAYWVEIKTLANLTSIRWRYFNQNQIVLMKTNVFIEHWFVTCFQEGLLKLSFKPVVFFHKNVEFIKISWVALKKHVIWYGKCSGYF